MDEFEFLKIENEMINLNDASDDELKECLEKLSEDRNNVRNEIDDILQSYI